ncbi:hypothetical protein P4O66_006665 [Electrophorus voltai]|uniref:Calcitonin peptide-like domain-containing protein n=1 Tax=Electrophorus voltai TaxID=2609070 RepID=A0AAD8ZFR5_9TELE|nr:hypothetical protein P4O66_006665 [Electrophorus voltai]
MESLCLRKACIPAHLNVCSLLQKTMSVLKISALLVTYALFVCQMYCTNAAPARPAVESSQDDATLTDYEARRLLNAIIKEFVQMTTEDLDQAETEENSLGRPVSKRCSNLSTCVLGKLSQELHKLQTITAQKRACNTATCVTHRLADFLSRSGGTGKFVPTNVGSRAFGRRRRLIEE